MASTAARLLLLSDDLALARTIQAGLEAIAPGEFLVTWTRRLSEAGLLLGRCPFDALLLDLSLPDGGPAQTICRVREADPTTPLVLLATPEQALLAALEEGVEDVLIKGAFSTPVMVLSLRHALRGRAAARVHDAALVDALTGLPTRRGLVETAGRLWTMPGRLKKGLTLLALNLEGTSAINATWGREAGDQALRETADLLRETFRGADLRARLGDDEFALLAVGAPEPTAPILLTRIEEAVGSRNATTSRPFAVSLVVGLAFYDMARPCAFDELLLRAEQDLRERRRGRPASVPARLFPPRET